MEMDEMLQKAKKTQVQRKKGPRWTGKKRVSGWPRSKIENWREDNACLWWNINFDDKSTCFTMTGKLKRAQVDWEGNWGEDSLSLSSTIYNLSISGKLKRARVDWDGNWGEDSLSLSSTIYNISISGKLKKSPGWLGWELRWREGNGCLWWGSCRWFRDINPIILNTAAEWSR